jgi:type IV secretory pathway VirJ component
LLAAWLMMATLASASVVKPASSGAKTNLKLREQTLTYPKFGQVALYRESDHPSRVVLFVSGDGGWRLGVVDMARHLADLDALVIGVNIRTYLKALARAKSPCSDAAADFEELGRFVQSELGYPQPESPILVGYSSGATLVYAALVQAEPGRFRGAMSLGFCPDLPVVKPFCAGRGLRFTANPKAKGVLFSTTSTLADPWYVFQGSIDQVCNPQETADYTKQVRHGELVWLDKVGHGFSVEKRWLPQFAEAFRHVAGAK